MLSYYLKWNKKNKKKKEKKRRKKPERYQNMQCAILKNGYLSKNNKLVSY